MKSTVSVYAAGFCVALLVVQAFGWFVPSPYNWGFHFLGFLPSLYAIVFFLLGIAAIIVFVTISNEKAFDSIVSFYKKQPMLFLSVSCFVFIGFAFLFKIKVPLLGDSFIRINILEHALKGEQAIEMYKEPIPTYFFYGLCKAFGATQSVEIQNAFFIGELFLGLAYIIMMYLSARLLFDDAKKQILLFCSVLVVPSMQIFFGYVEWYAVVIFCIALLLLTVVLYIRKNLPLYVIMLVYALLVITHVLGGLFFPAMIYLAYRDVRSKGLKNLLIGFLAIAVLVLFLYWQYNFNVFQLLHRDESLPFLTLSGGGDRYQAYTLFSLYYGVELLNLFVLLAPFTILLTLIMFSKHGRAIVSSIEGKLFLLYAIPYIIFFGIARLDLGMAKDWDVPATFMIPIYLFSGYLFLSTMEEQYTVVVKTGIVFSALLALPFFSLNATVEPNIERLQTIINSPLVSKEAYFASVSHLSKYYYNERDLKKLNELWNTFSAKYPNDWRGYRALTNSKIQLGSITDKELPALYDKWIAADSDRQSVKDEYLHYCIEMSKYYFGKHKLDSALYFNERAIRFDSTSGLVYNNLGVLYKAVGDEQKAINAYQKAIQLDSTYLPSYVNLANLFDDFGKSTDALFWYGKALAHDSTDAAIYENMAVTYFKLNDTLQYFASLKHAAHLGSTDAQQFLLKNGLSW